MEDIAHVRTHAELSVVVDKFLRLSREVTYLLIGLDTEGGGDDGPALLQLACRVGGERVTAVFQLRSKSSSHKPPHIQYEGAPSRLREIFQLKNAIFVGKSVAGDTYRAAKLAGLKDWDIDDVLNFVDALARGSDAMRDWYENDACGILGWVSLKNFVQFVDGTRILDKSPSHRNHLADFEERRNTIRSCDLQYAAEDSCSAVDGILDLSDKIGFPPGSLATSVGNPNVLNDVAFGSVIRRFVEFAGQPILSLVSSLNGISAKEVEMPTNLRSAESEIWQWMANFQKETLEFRAFKKMLSRKLRAEREGWPEPSYVLTGSTYRSKE